MKERAVSVLPVRGGGKERGELEATMIRRSASGKSDGCF